MKTKKSNASVYTVENAKVLRRDYEFYNVGTMGYLKEDFGLVYVGVYSILVDLKNESVRTTLKDAEGHEFERTGTFDLYLSPDHYEDNEAKKRAHSSSIEMIRRAACGKLVECESHTIPDESDETGERMFCYVTVWTFENGEAVETPIVVNAVEVAYEGKWHLNNGSIPEKFWESRKHAYDCNEYKVIDSDGEEFIEEGWQKRLSPTPEQWEIINEIRALYEKAKESGLKFFYDKSYDDSIKVLNANNVHEFGYEIGSFEGGDNIDLGNIWFADTNISIYGWYSDDGCHSAALNPTPRQKKEWLKSNPENA